MDFIRNLLRLEPSIFINAVGGVMALIVSAGLISQANGDALMTTIGVAIPAVLTILQAVMVRNRVYPAAKVESAGVTGQ